MDKQETVDAVRELYLRGEIEAVNVYCRLEHVASGAEIDALILQWESERKYIQFTEGCELNAQLKRAIIESDSQFEKQEFLQALDFLSWHVSHLLDPTPVCDDLREKVSDGICYAREVLAWKDRGGIGLLLSEGQAT